MRLYPPVASMSRQAFGPDDLAGKRIRKNSLVIVSQWVLHRHRSALGQTRLLRPAPLSSRRRGKKSIDLPICPSAPVRASASAPPSRCRRRQSSSPISCGRFPLELAKHHEVIPVQTITLRPKGGLPMILRRREPHAVQQRACAAASSERISGLDDIRAAAGRGPRREQDETLRLELGGTGK